jgi:hypothetical protein
MPLDLRFGSPELRAICERTAAAERLLGDVAARSLRARLSDIRAASDVRQVVLGRPSFSHPGRVAFHLSTTHRLVLAAAVTPMPRLPNKQIDWAKVTVLEVIEIY